MPIVNTAAPRVYYIRQRSYGWSVYPIGDFGLFERAWQRLNAQSGNSPLLEPAFEIPLIDYFARVDQVLRPIGIDYGLARRAKWQ